MSRENEKWFKELCSIGQFWWRGHEEACERGNYNSMSIYIYENHLRECEQCQKAVGLSDNDIRVMKLNKLNDE